jgi:general secretion pathway protein A
MYTTFFEFREKPFNVTPDPRFFYMNPVYRESYANLLTGIQERKGFVVMTGEVGTGKTTLLRLLMKNLEANVRFAYFYNTTLSFEELLTYACEELGLTIPRGGRLRKIQALNEFLIEQLRRGGTAALLIDEAQHLTEHVLESLRLLSNLETGTEKLLQIVLVGQPELEAKLAQQSLRQLKQRVALVCSLDRLKDREVKPYIQFRLESVGCERKDLFHPAAIERIAVYSGGVPRLINIICDNALTIAYASSERRVSREMIEEVAHDLRLTREASPAVPPAPTAAATPVEQASVPVQVSPAPIPAVQVPVVQASPAPPMEAPRVAAAPVVTANSTAPSAAVATPAADSHGVARAHRRPRRRTRWMVAALALAVAGGAAVWQADALGSIGASAWERARARSTAAVAQATEAWNLVWSQMASRPATPEHTPALRAEPAPPANLPAPAAEPPAPQEKAEPASNPVPAQWVAVPRTQAASLQDEPRVRETTPISLPPRQGAVVIQRGGTVSSLAYQAYGRYDMLAIDLIKEVNPHIDDLDWIRPGEELALPPLSAETLIRSQPGGGYRIVLGSFLNAVAAEKLAELVKQRGYAPRVTRRQVTGRLTLYRVEVADIASRHAAEQAWTVAVANCLVLIEACGGVHHEDKP